MDSGAGARVKFAPRDIDDVRARAPGVAQQRKQTLHATSALIRPTCEIDRV